MKTQVIFKVFLSILLCLFYFQGMAEANNKTEISLGSRSNFRNVEINVYGVASYLIRSKTGSLISTDPYHMPENLKVDIITVSHKDIDHNDRLFIKKNKEAKTSFNVVENFKIKDIGVSGIAASHNRYAIEPEWPSNVIYLFEIDNLRIAHTGDLGQKELTQEQLETLKQTDIVFISMFDLPQYGLQIEKSLKIIKQLKPRIVIPTHLDEKGYTMLHKTFKKIEHIPDNWSVSRDDIDNQKVEQVVVILEKNYGSILKQWKESLQQ